MIFNKNFKWFSAVSVLLIMFLLSIAYGKQKHPIYSKYEPSWESLNKHQIPAWLLDAKFGIYGHWGIYAVPAFKTEWYGRLMYDTLTRGSSVFWHHIKTYGKQSVFGYKDFIPQFTAAKFDPEEWADIIVKSGARYAGLTVVHHDGFCLWDSKYTRWDVTDMGPKRDLYGALVAAIRQADPDMKILSCFHHLRTYGWFFSKEKAMLERGRKEGWDIFNPEYSDFYRNPGIEPRAHFMNEWKNKVKEVIDKYQPDVIWFDGGPFRSSENEPFTLDVLSYFYNSQYKKGTPVEVINKKTNFPPDFGLHNFEKGGNRPRKTDFYWVDDLNIGRRGWGYTSDINYRSMNEIIDGFVDRVSRGGGLMLSISPKADGTIPEEQKKILLGIGAWLKINGDGIYETRKWKIETEGDDSKLQTHNGEKTMWNFDETCNETDIRFTKKGQRLFAFALGWPENGKLFIKSLGNNTKVATKGISGIKLLGHKGYLKYSRDVNGLTIFLPEEKPCDYAFGFEILIKGKLLND